MFSLPELRPTWVEIDLRAFGSRKLGGSNLAKAVTPLQYQPLLHDLFAANSWWELSATQAQSRKLGDGRWQVTLDLRARKLLVDDTGAEHKRPLDEWVEIGIYPGAARRQENLDVIVGKPMYLKKHRLTEASE